MVMYHVMHVPLHNAQAVSCRINNKNMATACHLICNKCFDLTVTDVKFIVLYFIVVGFRRLMPPDVLQPKTYCTNPGL